VGELDSARELVSSAMVSTRSLPVQTLGPCVLAIAATQEGSSDAEPLVERAVEVVQSSGEIDSFVSAYRSYPALLGAVAEIQRVRDWLLTVLVNARDTQLAKRFTLKPSRRESGDFDLLSARECEVLDLVAQGLTNRQIAKALYISESTTKVHLRHIYEKLAVRTRVEAAMKVNANALHATAANDAE
jgi:LuxR family maltose regulon positive regulatory protein